VSDKVLATRLLQSRDVESLKFGSFVRANKRRHLGFLVLVLIPTVGLLSAGSWLGFGFVVAFALGYWFCEHQWFRGIRESWRFNKRVTNWDLVKKISDDEPSA